MQKSHLSNRHYTRDYDRKNRDRPGGHCPTQVLREGWIECLSSHGRKYAKHVRAKAIRRANKLLIAEELLMFWGQIAEEQFIYKEDYWDENDYGYYYLDDYYDYYYYYECDNYDYYDYYDNYDNYDNDIY